MGDHLHQHQHLDLDPGFRFQPTDEELISFYLNQKVKDRNFCTIAIGEVDMNKCEPWELPMKAKMSEPGAKEWYFYYHKDRKYPMSHRTNRATIAGYWKITGKDKEIFHGHGLLIGMKKTLVFYMGRAPNGRKTNWVMHEYRIISNNDKMPTYSTNDTITQSSNSKDEWVVCRIFHKSIEINKEVVPSYPVVPMNNNQIKPHMPMNIGDQRHGFDPNTTTCAQIVQLPPLMDPTSSMYHLYDDNTGSSSLALLPTNDMYFASNQTPPMSLYQHHMQMPTQLGAMADEDFMRTDTWDIVHGAMRPQYHHCH